MLFAAFQTTFLVCSYIVVNFYFNSSFSSTHFTDLLLLFLMCDSIHWAPNLYFWIFQRVWILQAVVRVSVTLRSSTNLQLLVVTLSHCLIFIRFRLVCIRSKSQTTLTEFWSLRLTVIKALLLVYCIHIEYCQTTDRSTALNSLLTPRSFTFTSDITIDNYWGTSIAVFS